MENTSHAEKEAEKQVETQAQTAGDESTTATTKSEDGAALAKAQDELAESKDKYLRLYAEFENHRRRTAKERLEMIHSANEQLLKALLPVVDDFDRAEKSLKELSGKEADGVLLIYQKLKKILDQYGVKAMDAQGAFNPDLHEAITQVPDESKKGKIVEVVEKGYTLNDKVIRFAKVVVGC
jgi:molecular chaperone GrpE